MVAWLVGVCETVCLWLGFPTEPLTYEEAAAFKARCEARVAARGGW